MSERSRKAFKFVTAAEAPAPPAEDAWSRARSAIDKLKASYLDDWLPASLDELERTLKLALSNPDLAGEHLQMAYRLAHDMKGQGGTFGYSLISDIGGALCGLTYGREEATTSEIQAMLAHVSAARAVANDHLEDPESEGAVEVMGALQSAVRANLH